VNGLPLASLPGMRDGRVAVCLGTLLARAKRHVQPAVGHRRTDLDYGTQSIAYAIAQGQLAYYRLLAAQGEMQLTVRQPGDAGEDLGERDRGCKQLTAGSGSHSLDHVLRDGEDFISSDTT